MTLAVQLEPLTEAAPAVDFRWDADTDILTARLDGVMDGAGPTGSMELEGADGSWLILDIDGGRLAGLEVAVWPEVRKVALLAPPDTVVDGRLTLRPGSWRPDLETVALDIVLTAETDEAEAVIYFRVGASRAVRTVRVGRDLLVDLDRQQRLAGLWLLNVPPFPST